MGRRQGSIAARHGIVLLLALLASSCANTSVQVGSGAQPTAGAPGNSLFGAIMLFGFAASYEGYNSGVRYRANPFEAMSPAGYAPPPLDPARRVLVVDCTQPIEDWSANLRCR